MTTFELKENAGGGNYYTRTIVLEHVTAWGPSINHKNCFTIFLGGWKFDVPDTYKMEFEKAWNTFCETNKGITNPLINKRYE